MVRERISTSVPRCKDRFDTCTVRKRADRGRGSRAKLNVFADRMALAILVNCPLFRFSSGLSKVPLSSWNIHRMCGEVIVPPKHFCRKIHHYATVDAGVRSLEAVFK